MLEGPEKIEEIDLIEEEIEETTIVTIMMDTMAKEEAEVEEVEAEGEEGAEIMVKVDNPEPKELKVNKEDKATVVSIETTEAEKDEVEVGTEMTDKDKTMDREEEKNVSTKIKKLESFLKTKNKLK